MRRTCAFASPGFARKSQGQALRALERAGKETRPANMKDHLFAAPLCKSCNPLGPLRNPLPQTFPMGEFAERWTFSSRCIGFSSTAVRPVYWYGCSTHFTSLGIPLIYHVRNSLAAFLHASSSCLGMWTVKTFYRHNAMHLATRLTHTYLCTSLFVTIAYTFHQRRRQHCYLIRL